MPPPRRNSFHDTPISTCSDCDVECGDVGGTFYEHIGLCECHGMQVRAIYLVFARYDTPWLCNFPTPVVCYVRVEAPGNRTDEKKQNGR